MTTNKLFTGDDITAIVYALCCILLAFVLGILTLVLPSLGLVTIPLAIALTVVGLITLGFVAWLVLRDLRPKRRATHR
ncbi:hypothetical protein ACFVU2_19175 [Leifsonia sp. NPDC058194]|uniref:hypothetical protein n=1 Tax=Leifsonia sp. NPDC058194 TaxID=3346374 RepID=UPI0036DB0DD6